MKKILFSFVLLFSLCSLCSCDKDNDSITSGGTDPVNYDLYGIYQIENVIGTSNISTSDYDYFSLYNTQDEYDNRFRLYNVHEYKYKNNVGVGEFYANVVTSSGNIKSTLYIINKVEVSGDIITIDIYNPKYNSDVYKFTFKVIDYNYRKNYTLECLTSETTNGFEISTGSKITFKYQAYDCSELGYTK